jgi:serine protease Do
MRRLTLFIVALAASGCSVPAGFAQTSISAVHGMAPFSFAPLVKRVVPAVVNISVVEQGSDVGGDLVPGVRDRLRGRRDPVLGAGSGFIIDPSGIIVTNTHVVGRATRIAVTLADGTELPARLIGSDELTDIAVIRVTSPAPLPYVQWGDSRVVEVGDWILAAGNPFGVGISVTAGIVSARGRDIGAGPFDDFLQIDAPINPGNSGGPTFNMEGQVIAVNTAIVSPTGGSVGIGFAVPSEMAAKIVSDLRDKGHIDRGWLGVSVQDAPGTQISRSNNGVPIANIDRSGPAAKAGLKPGDIVMAINGTRVDTAQGLIKAVAATSPGNSVTLTVRRAGQNVQIPVTVGRRPSEQQG